MRKIISATLLFAVVIMCCSCSNSNKLKNGTYVSENTDYGYAFVVLSNDNEFTFGFQTLSYTATGKYTIEDTSLILNVNDDEMYIFIVDDGKLIFESGEWAEKMLEKGTMFQLSNE